MLTDPFLSVIQELFDANHRVVSQRGSSNGRFTFNAAESGDHKICFTPSSSSGRQGWLSTNSQNGGIKFNIDLAIGESSQIESSDKGKMDDLSQRVKDLNARLNDIRREQIFQRVSEGDRARYPYSIRMSWGAMPFMTMSPT